jgi:tetratricopeptide (TPR) repeat protein
VILNNDFRQAFFNGQECWQKNDYINARYWFEIAINDSNFRDDSLSKLIQIEIREGKYSKARQILVENKDISSIALKQIYGLLENIENNFERSKKYYSECMVDPSMQYKSLLAIAKLYMQTGDYEVARKMFETLRLNPKFYIQAIFGLVSLNIFEHNFFEAQKLMNEIDVSKLTPKLTQHYRIMDSYIKYFLGQLRMSDNKFDPVRDYMIYRLFDHSEGTLLNHIGRHCNQAEKETNGCFFKHIDTKKLLYDARDRIEDMNANHFEVSDMYRFKLDTPIGYKGNFITNDLCVVTIIGTKDIITMYPVQLSEEFDKEGLATSKELKLKRLQGGIKNDK